MAKRKLLNSEREIVLSQTLQHVFKDVLLKLDAEAYYECFRGVY